MSGKNSQFSVGESRGLIFTKGIVGKIFDLRKNGENGTVKNGPILSHFPGPHPATAHIPCAMLAISPSPPPFHPISPHFPHFSISPFFPFPPFFQTPKILAW